MKITKSEEILKAINDKSTTKSIKLQNLINYFNDPEYLKLYEDIKEYKNEKFGATDLGTVTLQAMIYL